MSDLFDDPAKRLENAQERELINRRNYFRREYGCYKCQHSKMENNKSICLFEMDNYPDRSSIEGHDNFCIQWRDKNAKKTQV